MISTGAALLGACIGTIAYGMLVEFVIQQRCALRERKEEDGLVCILEEDGLVCILIRSRTYIQLPYYDRGYDIFWTTFHKRYISGFDFRPRA